MRQLPAILAAFSAIDGWLEGQRDDAMASGEFEAVDGIELRRRVTSQAYFVLCWGQMETAVNEACLAAIQAGQALASHGTRRAWDAIEVSAKGRVRLSLAQRAALVLDPSDPSGHLGRLMRHYELRNRIAHGALLSDSIDLPASVADFFRIQGALEP